MTIAPRYGFVSAGGGRRNLAYGVIVNHYVPFEGSVGNRYSDEWHQLHLMQPRDVVPESNMPSYSWLATAKIDESVTPAKMKALRRVGVPYPAGFENGSAQRDLDVQVTKIVANLKQGSVESWPDKEIIALIAYLQRLGTDIKAASSTLAPVPAPTRTQAVPATTAHLNTANEAKN